MALKLRNEAMKLRDYQRESIDSLYDWFKKDKGNPLLVLPTGAGKSVIQAVFAKEAITKFPSTKIVVLTHVKELIQQNFEKILEIDPFIDAGVYSASLNSKDLSKRVTYAGIQSVYKKAFDFDKINLLIIDECHLIPKTGEGMYLNFINDAKLANPKLKIIGLTATPYRMKGGLLYEGEGKMFDGVSYEVDMKLLIKRGFLCPAITKKPNAQIDTSKVATRMGEFAKKGLQEAIDKSGFKEQAMNEIITLGKDRKQWLCFCVSVEHASSVKEVMQAHGITCETITGKTDKQERERIINDYKQGKIKCLTNCDVLTTGFDAPKTDMLILLRPTQSPVLYVQMIGRGMRISEGKEDCLVLDFAGNIERHGAVDMIKPKPQGKKVSQPPPMKECPKCFEIQFAGIKKCKCGFEFDMGGVDLSAYSSSGEVVSGFSHPQWLNVSDISFSQHNKIGKPPSLKVTYRCGLTYYSEWVCLEHSGFAREKAVSWWKKHHSIIVPKSIKAALVLSKQIEKPTKILVKKNGRYKEVVDSIIDNKAGAA